MVLGLLRRELPLADELGTSEWSSVSCSSSPSRKEVRARVADVAERHRRVLDERDGHRRAHPGGLGVLARALVDAAVRRLDQRDDALVPLPCVRARRCSAAVASLEATSPACAPPIPSAIANSGGSTT